jgi:hypothetical protein
VVIKQISAKYEGECGKRNPKDGGGKRKKTVKKKGKDGKRLQNYKKGMRKIRKIKIRDK